MSLAKVHSILPRILEFCQRYHLQSSGSGSSTPAATDDHHDLSSFLTDLQAMIQILSDPHSDPTVQFASLLTALRVSGLDRNQEVINTFVQSISSQWNLGFGLVDQRPVAHDPHLDPVCDIVGTGGDGFNTFNVSTTAAIVAAAAGVRVSKHGNRASSSNSGSADLIMALGIPLDRLEASQVAQLIQDPDCHFNFLFSTKYYPIFARLSPIRKSLGFPTIFNLLGPLLNPARPDRLIIGVSNPSLGPTFCKALQLTGRSQSWVVCSQEGLDEISTAGETSLWRLAADGSIIHELISPQETFGLPTHPIDLLTGESVQHNLTIFKELFDAEIKTPKHQAILDFVLMNTSALLVLAGKTRDFKDGVALARHTLMSGQARRLVESYRQKTLDSLVSHPPVDDSA